MYIPDLTNRKAKLIEVCVYLTIFISSIVGYIYFLHNPDHKYLAFFVFGWTVLLYPTLKSLDYFSDWWYQNRNVNRLNIILADMLAERRKEDALPDGPEMIPFGKDFRKSSSRWITYEAHTDDSRIPEKLLSWVERKANDTYRSTYYPYGAFLERLQNPRMLDGVNGFLEELPEAWGISLDRARFFKAVDRFEEAKECFKEAEKDLERDRKLFDSSILAKPWLYDYDYDYDAYNEATHKYYEEVEKLSAKELDKHDSDTDESEILRGYALMLERESQELEEQINN